MNALNCERHSGWRLSTQQISSYLRGLRWKPNRISPLQRIAPAPLADVITDPALREAVHVVCEPTTEFGILMGPSHDANVLRFYASEIADGTLVGHLLQDDDQHFIKPVKPSVIIEHVSRRMLLGKSSEPNQYDTSIFDLSINAYAALFALFDAVREQRLSRLLAREASPRKQHTASGQADFNNGVNVQQIASAAAKGLMSSDTRWLCSLGQLICPMLVPDGDESLRIGLAELDEAGCAWNAGELWQLNKTLQVMGEGLRDSNAWAVLHASHSTSQHPTHLAIIRGRQQIWRLDFSASRVVFSLASELELEFDLGSLLTGANEPVPNANVFQP